MSNLVVFQFRTKGRVFSDSSAILRRKKQKTPLLSGFFPLFGIKKAHEKPLAVRVLHALFKKTQNDQWW